MFDRRFGVELEMGVNHNGETPGDEPPEGCTCEPPYLSTCDWCDWDYRVERTYDSGVDVDEFCSALAAEGVGHVFDYGHYDGTAIEIPTVPLRGEAGLGDLKRLLIAVNKLGGYTTEQDGTHIHIEATDYARDDKLIERLGKTWLANQDHIYKTVDPQRVDWHYCPQFTQGDLMNIVNRDKDDYYWDCGSGERCDLNFEALDEHGTIEIRLHEGTLNFEELRAWIIFMGTMIDTVAQRQRFIPTVKSLNHLFTSLKLDRKTRSQLRRKAGIKAAV